jgi:hypothetical protein
MKQLTVLVICLSILLFACSGNEKENQGLTDEVRMLREENNYLKARIVGLQKELDEVKTKVKEEREGLQRKLDEEREQMQKKVEAEREALHKHSEEAAKRKSGTAVRKEPREAAPKNGKPHGGVKEQERAPAQ